MDYDLGNKGYLTDKQVVQAATALKRETVSQGVGKQPPVTQGTWQHQGQERDAEGEWQARACE